MPVDWNDLRFFLAVQRGATLKAAGSALKIDPTTVGRRLAALEAELSTRLFDRTPDGYVLTSAGVRLLPIAESMAERIDTLVAEIAGEDHKLEGRVRLTATEMLATRFIMPYLPTFSRRYPNIRLEVDCSSEVLSLSRREVDVALRLSRPREDGLVAQRLSAIELGLYASPRYAADHPLPKTAEQGLTGHHIVAFADTSAFTRENSWLEEHLQDALVVMRSNSVSALYAATVAGLGIALLPCIVADKDPRLVRIPSVEGPKPRWIWQIVHRDLQHTARVRAVLGFVSRVLSAQPTQLSDAFEEPL
jgi:DNA-binding transcriptional LysR family regulator